MEANQNSLHLLSHFNVAHADEVTSAATAAVAVDATPTRGVGWVLRWAAALGVLFYATTVLIEFAYCVAGEQLLARAARAGALEATLPRATLRTIEQTVWRRLEGRELSRADVNIVLLQNDRWVGKRLRPSGGDQFAVTLTMPAQAIMPGWLRALTRWRGDARINAQAERVMPGRKLLASTSQGASPVGGMPAPRSGVGM